VQNGFGLFAGQLLPVMFILGYNPAVTPVNGTASNKISTPADMPLPHLSLDQNIVA